jgi:hypothetical protein
MEKINKFDIAYISGYIDGDGCFYIGHDRTGKRLKPKPTLSIIIVSTNKDILLEFQTKYGGSVNLEKKEFDNRKAVYHFTLKKYDSMKLAQKMVRYLVEKKEECETALEYADTKDLQCEYDFIDKINIIRDVANLVSHYHVNEFTKVRNTIVPKDHDFAYLAGFIDAECSLNIQKYKPKNKPNYVYKILLQCNNTKAPVFKWLMQRFGGHIHFVDRRKYKLKNQLTWRLSGRALSKILHDICPHLRHKKPVCEQLIKFYATTLINGGARHTEIFRDQYARTLKEREEIVAEVHRLNKKGPIDS